jgi:hypothetical protein
MASKRFKTISILFNIIMVLLILISYLLILSWFEGHGSIIAEGIWLFGGGPYPTGEPQLVETYPTLNYPLIILIFTLIVNSYFLIRLKRSRQ